MISIVIVNWNSGPLLVRCIRSLHEHAPGSEIVVVDNDSTDGSLDCSRRPDISFAVIGNSRNMGFAAACNQGWKAATATEVLFLNPDTECMPGGVARLHQRLQEEEGIWAVGGRLLDVAGEPQAGFNVRAFPTIGSTAAELLLLDEIWPGNRWTRRYRMTDWDYGSDADVDQPAGACLMVRRARLESLGGFDERFRPAWFEDVDLCKRIRNAGGRIAFEPGACFRHHGGVSLHSLSREEFLHSYHSNQILYFEKHHGRLAAARVRRLVIAGLYLRALLSVYRGTARGAYWRAARRFVRLSEAGT